LKVLGFVNRRAAAVSWQVTTLALVGIVIGVPLGLAVGQEVGRTVASEVGVVPVAAASRSRPGQLLRER
jgi:predicted MFS family arabinose efflux permease